MQRATAHTLRFSFGHSPSGHSPSGHSGSAHPASHRFRSGGAPSRRRVLAGAAGLALLSWCGRAGAQDLRYFRIATGTTGGTYFPIGGLIANAISNPPGSRPCEKGGSCGVPGLIAVAQATNGSVENIDLLRSSGVEAGMAQADVAYWAYTGTGTYAGKPPFEQLRTIGTLYAEAIHIVVRADSDIHTVSDLKGKVVSVGEEGSGTLVDLRLVLQAYGLSEEDLEPRYLKPGTAADRLARGEVEAFSIVGGAPVAAVGDAAGRLPVRLVPIDGPVAARLRATHRFFAETTIPADTYPGVPATTTLSVGAELLVRADIPEETVYGVTRALWHENTRRLLAEGHPKGRSIDPSRALAAIAVPLHPGAERYYREAGLIGAAGKADVPAPQPQPQPQPKGGNGEKAGRE